MTFKANEAELQCYRFGRNIAYVTPKIIYLFYQNLHLWDQNIQKYIIFNFQKNFTAELPLWNEALENGTTWQSYLKMSLDLAEASDATGSPPIITRTGRE